MSFKPYLVGVVHQRLRWLLFLSRLIFGFALDLLPSHDLANVVGYDDEVIEQQEVLDLARHG